MADFDDDIEADNMDRRGMLNCMGWIGAGALYTISAGVAASISLDAALAAPVAKSKVEPFTFLQISDSHIGFKKAVNPDPLGTLRETITKIRSMAVKPAFVLHTGDITQSATPEQFALAKLALSELGVPVHYVPGEHDLADGENVQPYLDRYGAGTKGEGWYSFDAGGAHFIGLVNSIHLRDGGVGSLGEAQIVWLRDDVAHLSSSTPIIVFAHMPMWALFPEWGWGTADSAVALKLLRRFGSVTVLNGHIHQIQQRVEGHVMFHTARSTAFPQPPPGQGAGPGPLAVPAEQLRSAIGLTSVSVKQGKAPIALIDTPLARL
jgi:3',5'-cyclic-AMP phosphodiesterase